MKTQNHACTCLTSVKGGWAVVSTTRKYKPILAFSDTGSMDLNNSIPEGLDIWKENMI